MRVLQSALAFERPGRYQIEAAISALHDDAASAGETDWPQILAWYDDLVALTGEPSRQDPAAVLGRAVAVGHVLGAAAGLRETDRLRDVIGERHRWHAVRGYLHELGGDLPGRRHGLRRGGPPRHERRRARPPGPPGSARAAALDPFDPRQPRRGPLRREPRLDPIRADRVDPPAAAANAARSSSSLTGCGPGAPAKQSTYT